MPTITYMSWNIQDFGQGYGNHLRGDYFARCGFIARVARKQNADILALIELTQAGVARLPLLQTALYGAYPFPNDTWLYDWLPGAYNAALPFNWNNVVTNIAQLNWEVPANREGYAMFWLHNPAKFDVLPAPHLQGIAGPLNTQSNGVSPPLGGGPLPLGVPPHALTLVLEGRGGPTTAVVPGSPWRLASPGVNPPAAYAWDDLDFPTPWVVAPNRNASRRPCFFNIRLNTPGLSYQRIVPIVAYHAPSLAHGSNSAARGTQLAAWSLNMFMAPDFFFPYNLIYTQKVIASGDFNVDGNAPLLPALRHQAYDAFTDPFGVGPPPPAAGPVGANCTPQVPLRQQIHANTTYVALNTYPGGPPIQGGINNYRRLGLDNIFHRGFANTPVPPRGRVYNLLTAVQPGGSMTGSPVQNFLPVVNNAIHAPGVVMMGGVPYYPGPAGLRRRYPNILNFPAFYAQMTAGQFTTARCAAEFINLFVSDHLPVTFRFVVP